MKRDLELIDDYQYTLELEKPKTVIIKKPIKVIQKETTIEITEGYKKPLVINPVYRYNKDGELVDKYLNASQMAKKLQWREGLINRAADHETHYNGFLLSRTSYTKEKLLERFTSKKKPKIKKIKEPKPKPIKEKKPKPIKEKQPKQIIEKKPKVIKPKKEKVVKDKIPYIQQYPIYQYNDEGELLATYPNGGIMSKETGWCHNTIKVFSTKERVYKGFLITRVHYSKQEAKQRFTEALNKQQMTYIYNIDGKLITITSSLTQAKEIIGSTETLRRISYFKEKLKPINGFVLSNKPLY